MKIGGYPEFKKEFVGATGALQSFDGKKLGTCRIVSMWRTPRSWVSSHMFQIEATIDGVTYTGRGAGSGMSSTSPGSSRTWTAKPLRTTTASRVLSVNPLPHQLYKTGKRSHCV